MELNLVVTKQFIFVTKSGHKLFVCQRTKTSTVTIIDTRAEDLVGQVQIFGLFYKFSLGGTGYCLLNTSFVSLQEIIT